MQCKKNKTPMLKGINPNRKRKNVLINGYKPAE